MTILGVKKQLIQHFLSHDTFDPKTHPFELECDKETADYKDELLVEALTQLEQEGIIRKLAKPESAIWVLNIGISSFPQVTLSPETAEEIAEIVNHYNELDEIDVECDPTQIDEADIGRLIDILHELEGMAFGDDDEPEGGPSLKDYTPGVN